MASSAIENSMLRVASFPDLAKYFKQLLTRLDNGSITGYLLSGLATDSVPFRTIAVWIAGFADAPSIARALRYEQSAGVRRVAIKRFAKCLRNQKHMTAVFDAVGGTSGLMELFSELSVHDVQSFCHALGHTCTWNVAKEMRQRQLSEFVESLLSNRNPEKRTFIKFYANIVPACTIEFVRAWEANETLPRAGGRWMDHAHYKHTRERCIQHLTAEKGKNFKFKYFENVFYELPPTPASKYMSQSMLFSLELLDFLGQHEEVKMPADDINDNIFAPLIRRLNKRGAPHDVRAKVLRSVARALGQRISDGGIVDMNQHGPLRNAVTCWNSDTAAYHQLLLDIMHLVPEKQRHVALDRVGTLLTLVRQPLRYELLALAAKHLKPLSKDLEKDDELSELGPWPSSIFASLRSDESHSLLQRLIRLRLKDTWRGDIFTGLEPEHAAPLLEELSELRPAGDFIDWRHLRMLSNPIFKISHNVDVAMLQLCVSPASTERDMRWKDIIEERKKEAARAREQVYRATWARSAILCSVASGSLKCYEETLLWARRFNGDALTVKQLYHRDTICTSATIALLGGISSKLESSSAEKIKGDVENGNKIMLLLLETAFQGLREPSFQSFDWDGVLGIFAKVVSSRLAGADRVQDSLSLSDTQMYEMLWQDTLRTVISAEGQCLMDEHEKLNAQTPGGILRRPDFAQMRNMRPSKCKFVDEIAKCRDELWAKHRRSKDPNVVTLEAPFPKGLSVQGALPFNFGEGYAGRLPYLESRAESVVFADPRSALSSCPSDRAVRKAIERHVDDYGHALGLYVNAGVDGDDKRRRGELAWKHATGPLSKHRGLSANQAKMFWKRIFEKSAVDISQTDFSSLSFRPDPLLPHCENPEEPTEWNPDPNPLQYTTYAKKLEPTCLDAMLQDDKVEIEIGGTSLLRQPEATTGTISRDAFWDGPDKRPVKSIAPDAREGLLALGVMLINNKCCLNLRLFSKPFPSPQDARFPAMYLDEEFLDRDGISQEDGFIILEKLSKDAPLTLVAELCEAMLLNLGQGSDPKRNFEKETLRLLKILVESHRPDLALNLVHKVVIERPDASSWHRHMLTKGLFDRLKRESARRFLQELATSMKTGLQEQAQRKPIADEEQAVAVSPIIKVTTVTAMAQLLSSANFVSGEQTVNILTDIFSGARHPDIVIAIISSLTSILGKTRHDSVKAQVMDALEEHALPVASSMSERSPMTEDDWQRAESVLELPEVNEPQTITLQPVLRAIVDAYGSLNGETVLQLYRRVLLPVLDASTANNRRWMRLFLRKHKLHCRLEDLPLVPIKPHFLPQLMRKDVQDRREEIFHLWGEAVMVNLDPPVDVLQVNSTITNNKDLRASNAGKHWLSLWSNPGAAALSFTGAQLHQYLTSPNLGTVGALPIPLLQQMVFQQLEVMITDYDRRSSELDHLLEQLARPLHKNEAWEETWERNVRPLIKQVVDKIESIRTPSWQRQSHRVPATLRDTYDTQIWLLTWPGWQNTMLQKPEHDARLERFANELSHKLTDLVESGKPYHTHFPQLQDAACAVNPRDFAYLAVHLGGSWGKLGLADYLGVEIAEALLQKVVAPKSKALTRQVGEMVVSWKGSADETVRMSGIRAEEVFEGQRTGRMSWFWEGWGRGRSL